jgi:hypothetical protein
MQDCCEAIITEMNARFDDEVMALLRGFSALLPRDSDEEDDGEKFLNSEELLKVVDFYKLSTREAFIAESQLAKKVILKRLQEGDQELTLENAYKIMLGYQEVFPSILAAYEIVLTVGCSSASCERSFSALKLVKTYLRSTMKEDRLNGLSLMYIEKDVKFTPHEVIEKFAQDHGNRRIVLF